MSLITLQFILISFLPASFLTLILYLLYSRQGRQGGVTVWLLGLLTIGIWSSSLLSYYTAGRIPYYPIGQGWRLIGNYALTLFALWVLLATIAYLWLRFRRAAWLVILSALLWLGALALDPAIWPYYIPSRLIAGQLVRHFDMWGIVWVASWLMPAVSAWLLTQWAASDIPRSLYRNRLNYWLLALSLFLLGGALGLTRDLILQQVGALVLIGGAFIGSYSIGRGRLPDLQLMLRRLMGRLLGTAAIFGLTFLAFWLISQTVAGAPEVGWGVELIFAAALFAALFLIIHYLINRTTQALFTPQALEEVNLLEGRPELEGSALPPAEWGRLILDLVQNYPGARESCLMLVEEGPGGRVILRPLAALSDQAYTAGAFSPGSPFVQQFRQTETPLLHYDLRHLKSFAELAEEEKEVLEKWEAALYVPLYAGARWQGLLLLGEKLSGNSYNDQELNWLQEVGRQYGPLLAHSQTIASLYQSMEHLTAQKQQLGRDRRRLEALNKLRRDFLELLSPELRRPLNLAEQQLQRFQEAGEEPPDLTLLNETLQNLARFKLSLNNLISLAARINKQERFHFQPVQIDDLVREARQRLLSMSEARRVRVDLLFNQSALPPVYGDEERLLEAIQHLLHNAIKFNKIGGLVRLECGVDNGYIFINVVDNGVGMSAERLAGLWQGFPSIDTLGASHARGLGVGLLFVQYIVQAHGGRLTAESKHGAGSIFSMHLPVYAS